MMRSAFWNGKRVLVTGHTGFKGGWLSLWLESLGAEVSGLALAPPAGPSLFEAARVGEGIASAIGDIRSYDAVLAAFEASRPEIVLHLAAQPLVRDSYRNPVDTYATNVMGTVHVLEAARQAGGVRALVNVTTDKCYENREWLWGYREDEALGGHDPYSSSKACSELVTGAYRRSFPGDGAPALASARAGNVIGGGDWAPERLVPDILRAFGESDTLVLRHPGAIRPWQHVLEPLAGYLALAERLYDTGAAFAEAWNFGPADDDARPVGWIVEQMARRWGGAPRWQVDDGVHLHEAHYLKLDSSKAKARLGWSPRWRLIDALGHTVDWHRAWLDGADMRAVCLRQIELYNATRA